MSKNKKQILFIFSLLLSIMLSGADTLKSFRLQEVRLLEGVFCEAQKTDMDYILEMNVDRLLAPYLKDAGITPLKENYGNWENTGLDGHIGGHYLSALSIMYASTENVEILNRINYIIDWLDSCQQKNGNGYIGGIPNAKNMWVDISNGIIDAANFSLNGKWVPLYNIHKIFAGLRDAYILAENDKALEILIALTDWFYNTTKNLSDNQIQKMLISEHGGLNEVFVDVAELTSDNKYLELANRFSHRLILNPLLNQKNELTGLHANTQIPKVVGFKRYADVANNIEWSNASAFFWNTVINNWTISIGGNSVAEHFHPANDFSSMVESNQGPETCNTYNMLRLTKLLFLSNPEEKYINYYERALYNHILSSQHPDKGGFVYFTPMRSRHYKVYSQPHESFWCCVGSGMENHGKYGEMIYAHDDTNIYVNLFIASELQWKEMGVVLTQNTEFPYKESSSIQLQLVEPKVFDVNIRKPEWLMDGVYKILVNSTEISTETTTDYVNIKRQWQTGDKIEVLLPMKTSIEYLPDGSDWVSFIQGPIVLAAETGTDNLEGLWADESRMGHVAEGPQYATETGPYVVPRIDLSKLIPIDNKPMNFSMSDIIYTENFQNLILKPFNEIHEARYIVYWPVTSDIINSLDAGKKIAWNSSIAYPNPIKRITTFSYSVPENRHVFLAIYKSDGGLVEVLVDSELHSGDYSDEWNASDLPEGFYFYKLQIGAQSEAGKLLKVKQ